MSPIVAALPLRGRFFPNIVCFTLKLFYMENQAVFVKDLVFGMDVEFEGNRFFTVNTVELYPSVEDVEFVFVGFQQFKSRVPMYPLQTLMVRVVHDPAAEIELMREKDGDSNTDLE